MAKSRISKIVDMVIDNVEIQLTESNKHVIRVETVKNRAMVHIDLGGINEDSDRCIEVGFDQIVHNRLYNYGYRSVRTGMFINLDACESIPRLKALLDSEDATIADKQKVWAKIKKQLDGQMRMQFEGSELASYVETMTEEEFLADLEADAV